MTPEAAIDWLVEKVRLMGIEGLFNRWYGIYPGVVEDNDDPEKRGRVRVRVLALGQKKAPAAIWALPAVFGGSEATGIFFPPNNEDRVWVQFIAGNPSKPVYMGGVLGKGKTIPEFSEVYLRGLKTSAGHWVRFSDDPDDEHVTITSSSGASVTLDKDGGVSVEAQDGGTIVMDATAPSITVTDSAGSSATLRSGQVTLDTGDGTTIEIGSSGVSVVTQKSVSVRAASAAIDAQVVTLGEGAAQSLILGDAFAALYATHTHIAIGTPTSPPVVPMIPGVHLSLAVKTK